MTAASFQSTVRTTQGFGVVGELFSDAPKIVTPTRVNDAGTNIVGYAYTVVSEGLVRVGGAQSAFFAGILVNPKEYALRGDGVNPLNPSLEIAPLTECQFLQMGEIIIQVGAAAAIGDDVVYDLTTGALSTVARGTAYDDETKGWTYGTITRFTQGVAGTALAVAMFTFPTQLPAPDA